MVANNDLSCDSHRKHAVALNRSTLWNYRLAGMLLAAYCSQVMWANMVFHLNWNVSVVDDYDPHCGHHHCSWAVVLESILLDVVTRVVANKVCHQIHCHNLCRMMVDMHFGLAHNSRSPDGTEDFHRVDWGSSKCPFRPVEHQWVRRCLDLAHLDQAYNWNLRTQTASQDYIRLGNLQRVHMSMFVAPRKKSTKSWVHSRCNRICIIFIIRSREKHNLEHIFYSFLTRKLRISSLKVFQILLVDTSAGNLWVANLHLMEAIHKYERLKIKRKYLWIWNP